MALAAIVTAGILLPGAGSAQIVNPLRAFDNTDPGWSGAIGAFLDAKGGNTESVTATGALRVQWRDPGQRVRLLADGTRETTEGELTEESTTTHLRHNARLSDRFFTVAFGQHQHDPFQRLTARFLLGTGVRWDWLRGEKRSGSWGVTPMLEAERIEGEDTEVGGRLSTFVSLLTRAGENVTLDLTGFLQPGLDDAEDIRAVAAATAEFAVTGRVSLLLQGEVTYDSEPADDVEDTDWKTQTGLSIEL